MPPRDEMPSQSELAPVYEKTGRRLRQSTVNEELLRLRAATAREKAESLHSRPETDPERQAAELAFEEANLDLEIFDLTHDPTGALKREAIGGDLAEQLTERMMAEKEPQTVVSPEHITPVFLVNMGELDRLNKVSPDFGNQALVRLAERLSDQLDAALEPLAEGHPEQFYKIYRADNNSFMVRFLKEVPKEVAEALREHLAIPSGSRWEEPPQEGKKDTDLFQGRTETPPVIADYVSIEDVLSGLPPSLRTSGKAETYAVGALKDVLFSLQDARKIVSRVERMREAMAQDPAKAKDLYDKFLKKSIAGTFSYEVGPDAVETPVETYEQFEGFLKSLESDPAHAQGHLWETAFGKVLADLRLRYEKDARYAKQLQGFVADKVKAEHGLNVYERRSSAPPGGPLPEDRPVNEFVPPNRTDATDGLRIIAALEAEAAKEYPDPAKKRLAEKRLERERAMRDYATGLELRGSMFRRLESAMEDPNKRVASISMDMGFLKYFDQVGGRETGDLAILKVAEIFQKVEDAFSEKGIEISTHRLGGDEFGMSVVGDASLTPDEFRTKLREIQVAMYREIERAGRIPPMAGSKPGYYGTKLNIGIGTHVYENGHAADTEDARYGLSENPPEDIVPGLPSFDAWKRNQRAEHLVKVADKVMEFQKASNRLMLLVEKIKGIQDLKAKSASEEDIRREEEHLKQLLAFSDKAIFGQKGRERLGVTAKEAEEEETSGVHQKTWAEQLASGVSPEDLDSQIHEFVWEMMDKAFQQEVREHEDLGSHVGYAVRIEYLSGRIRELEARLNQGGEVSEKMKERYAHEQQKLEQKLKAAEEDLEAVRAARAAISG